MICLYLLPLFGALLGWIILSFTLRLILRHYLPAYKYKIYEQVIIELEKEMGEENPLVVKMQGLNLEGVVSPVLDRRLDQVVQDLKEQIPMGEYILMGSLTQRIKMRVKSEFLKALPDFKAAFLQQIEKELNPKQFIHDKVYAYDFNKIIQSVSKQGKGVMRALKWMASGIGFILGCLFMLICWFIV
jgi:hypothetical protein